MDKKTKKEKTPNITNGTLQTTPDQLFRHLAKASDILRGPINQDEFKNYITPMLFFKRLSDVFDEECEKSIKEFGEDFPENHRFIIPEGCHWIDIRNENKDIGTGIVKAMKRLNGPI